MIHLDTNYLIMALVPGSPQDKRLREWLAAGEIVSLGAIVWAEFLCGPVTPEQQQLAAALFPDPAPLLAEDAARAADLFNATGRRRGSLADCMIAAMCLRLDATLATENHDDFSRFVSAGLKLAPK